MINPAQDLAPQFNAESLSALRDDALFPVSEAAAKLEPLIGVRLHRGTPERWMRGGVCGGQIKLAAVFIGRRAFTSLARCAAFFDAVTAARAKVTSAVVLPDPAAGSPRCEGGTTPDSSAAARGADAAGQSVIDTALDRELG